MRQRRWRLRDGLYDAWLVYFADATAEERRAAVPGRKALYDLRWILSSTRNAGLADDVLLQVHRELRFLSGSPNWMSHAELLRLTLQEVENGRLLLVKRELQRAQVHVTRPVEEPPPKEAESARETTWIEVELVNETGEPARGARVLISFPDGRTRESRLDSNGRLRLDYVTAGTCQVSFPAIPEFTPTAQ